jgi:HAMP domain-containing protein
MIDESSSSLDVRNLSFPVGSRPRGMSLWKRIAGTFTGITVILGLLVIGIVYEFTGRALRAELHQRALAVATNLSDAAAGFVMGRNILELNALITKYARLDGVAYVFMEDIKGEVIATSQGTLPSELRPSSPQDLRQTGERSLTFRGRPVQETRMPILEGRAGAAHVGIWTDVPEAEIRRVLLPIISLIAAAVIACMISSILLTRRIIRPILGLVAVADEISKGNLDATVAIDSNGEIGELARSLERMRTSLKVAINRLSRK